MNKKIASEIAIGVIVLIAIIVGVLLWIQNKKEIPIITQTEVTKPIVSVSQPTTQTEAVDETANWQTYTNTKYGFEFKHPKGWSVKEDNAGNMPKETAFTVFSSTNDLINFDMSLVKSEMDPKAWYMDGDDLELNKAYTKNKVDYRQLTINGYPAFYVSKEVPQAYWDMYYIISNNNGLIIKADFRIKGDWTKEVKDYGYSYEKYLADFERMINSFKFTK